MITISDAQDFWIFFIIVLIIMTSIFYIHSKQLSKDNKGNVKYSFDMSFYFLKFLLYLISIIILSVLEINVDLQNIELYQTIAIAILVVNLLDIVKNMIYEFTKKKKERHE